MAHHFAGLIRSLSDPVIGVDTHRDRHAAAIPDPNGGLVAQRAPGRRCWAVEGTGSYGAGLASFLADRASG